MLKSSVKAGQICECMIKPFITIGHANRCLPLIEEDRKPFDRLTVHGLTCRNCLLTDTLIACCFSRRLFKWQIFKSLQRIAGNEGCQRPDRGSNIGCTCHHIAYEICVDHGMYFFWLHFECEAHVSSLVKIDRCCASQ